MRQRPQNSRIKHGDPSCADYGCKREECLEARRRKQKRNKVLRSTGRPGMVGPERVAAHIAKFRAAGLQDKEIILQLGLARNTFYRILRGLPLTRLVEQRILSVPAPRPTGQVTTLAAVPAVGTHRRLQALLWQGWPTGELEQRLGVHVGWITRSFRERKSVTMAVEARVKALYDALWNLAAVEVGVDAELVAMTRRLAAKAGFQGPLAWDDDTIDDPNALPQVDAAEPIAAMQGENVVARWLMGESVVLGAQHRDEALLHLFEWSSLSSQEIADRLGMSKAAAEQVWFRAKRKARTESRREPWRRVWSQMDREMKQNDMEEAA